MGSSEFAGIDFGIVFLVIVAIFIGLPILFILIGGFVKRRLIRKGYSKKISIAVGTATTLILLSAPFLDYPYKKILINDYCEKEGGLHVSKMVTGVEGILNLPYSPAYGYHYFEAYVNESDKTGLHRVYRERFTNEFTDVKIDTPSAYGFKMFRSHVVSSIYRVVLQTYVTATGEELGRYVYFESNSASDTNVSLIDGMRFWMRMQCPDSKTKDGSTGYYQYLPELLQSTLRHPAMSPDEKSRCEEEWRKYKKNQECLAPYKISKDTYKAESTVSCGTSYVPQPVQCN